MAHAGKRSHRPRLQATHVPVVHGERHHRAHVDVPAPVGDGRAVEVEPPPVTRLHFPDAAGIVEPDHRSDQGPGVAGWRHQT